MSEEISQIKTVTTKRSSRRIQLNMNSQKEITNRWAFGAKMTSYRSGRSDVNTTSCLRHVPAG